MTRQVYIHKRNRHKGLISLLWRYKFYFVILFGITFISTMVLAPELTVSKYGRKFVSSSIDKSLNLIENGFESRALSILPQTDGYTAGLILGIDSRKTDINNGSFVGKDRNTDTIIQVVYDHKENNIFLINIPRDTGYNVSEDCVKQGYDKAINRIYKYAEDNGCREGGIEIMKKYVTKITGFENHYHALVSFDTFQDVCNAIGEVKDGKKGLWINIPQTIYELYPTDYGYESFTIKQGYQHLNCYDLLRYSRSRQNSSDFARARRQQLVLESFKSTLINSKTWSNPITAKKLFDSFDDNAIYSDVSLDEIVAGASLIDEMREARVYNLILDDTFGGQNRYISKPTFSTPGIHNRPGYYLTAINYKDKCCTDDDYLQVKEYINSIRSNPDIYAEEAEVVIYNSTAKYDNLDTRVNNWINLDPPINKIRFSKYPYKKPLRNITLVDLTGEKPNTLKYIQNAIGGTIRDKDDLGFNPGYNEDIAIILD